MYKPGRYGIPLPPPLIAGVNRDEAERLHTCKPKRSQKRITKHQQFSRSILVCGQKGSITVTNEVYGFILAYCDNHLSRCFPIEHHLADDATWSSLNSLLFLFSINIQRLLQGLCHQ